MTMCSFVGVLSPLSFSLLPSGVEELLLRFLLVVGDGVGDGVRSFSLPPSGVASLFLLKLFPSCFESFGSSITHYLLSFPFPSLCHFREKEETFLWCDKATVVYYFPQAIFRLARFPRWSEKVLEA